MPQSHLIPPVTLIHRRLDIVQCVRSRRAGVTMAFGAVTVHELRYLLAYDGDGARLLEHDGHPYLAALSPLVALVLVYLLNRSLRDRRSSWLWLSGGLLGVYGAQALMEGALAPGQLTGIDSLVGHGGWVALPLAAAAAWLAVRAVRILRQRLVPRVWSPLGHPPAAACVAFRWLPRSCSAVIAWHLAGRAPPLVVSKPVQ